MGRLLVQIGLASLAIFWSGLAFTETVVGLVVGVIDGGTIAVLDRMLKARRA